MTVTTTTVGSSQAVAALYQAAYIMSVRNGLMYSQAPFVFTPPQGVMGVGNRGSNVTIPMFHQLDVGSSLSETADVTPVVMYQNLVTVTPELYGQAVQLSQKLSLEAFTDVEQAAVEIVGRSAAATRDYLAREVAIGGAQVVYGGAATTRTTNKVNEGASTTVIAYADFVKAITAMNGANAPKIPGPGNLYSGGYAAIISAETQADLGMSSGIILASEYGGTPNFLLNGEIGTHLTGVKLIQSPNAKVFRGVCTAIGTSGASGGTAIDLCVPGATSIGVVSTTPTSWALGDYWAIGSSQETSSGNDVSKMEVVRIVSGTTNSTGPFGIVGAGVNGGLLYGHSSGTEKIWGGCNQRSGDVQCTVFMSGEALGMVYSNEDGLGPEGQIILPEVTGILHQFSNTGWKGFWGFGRIADNRLLRVESGSSFQSIGE